MYKCNGSGGSGGNGGGNGSGVTSVKSLGEQNFTDTWFMKKKYKNTII